MNNFWDKVLVAGKDDCWPWRGKPDEAGYGRLKRSRKQFLAHRYAWSLVNGSIPEGKQINHTCDVPICVNPEHLYAGTQLQNMQDKVARNRHSTGAKNGSHTRPDRRPKGERVGGAKLTEMDILFIRYWLSKKIEGKEIARAFNITGANVSCIKNRTTWAHIQ